MGNGGSKKRSERHGSVINKSDSSLKANSTTSVPPLKTEVVTNPPQTTKPTTTPSATAETKQSTPKNNKKSDSQLKKTESEKNFSPKRLEELFSKYKASDDDIIGAEGIVKLCDELGVSPDDVVVLVFAYHLNAQSMSCFSKEEFVAGLQKMGIDSISKLKGQFPAFKKELDEPTKFKEIYKFAFNFAKESPDQKIISVQIAEAVLKLLLSENQPHTKKLVKYLSQQTSYKALNMDQWMGLLEFQKSIKEDLSNYDENQAWPVILDEYAAWLKKNPDA